PVLRVLSQACSEESPHPAREKVRALREHKWDHPSQKSEDLTESTLLPAPRGPAPCHSLQLRCPLVSSHRGSRKQEALPDSVHLLRYAIDDKVGDLVSFLLLRYHRKEVATKAEMLSIIKDYQDLFPVILSQATECMRLVFGIDVQVLDPTGLFYVLVNTLGLTYNDLLSGDESLPTAGLLVNTLSIIFIDGNCASEEKIWEMLGIMGLYGGMNHFIYGDPRKLLTQVWVQEGYLEYRQVPNSDPAHYEFLWGPRTYLETTKMKVLDFLAKVHGTTPSAFPSLYEDALTVT
uniref:MAGE domain-containing protein n=1 Tax=Moschus moschiferus TaxID=68415 RepID=A0A8C6CYM4_MOSMO